MPFVKDPRMLHCRAQQDVEANFNRVLALADTLAARVTALDSLFVVYDANTGAGEMVDPASPYAVGTTATVLACEFTPPEGKVFSKWNTAANGSGTDYQPEAEIEATTTNRGTTITLYAVWVNE